MSVAVSTISTDDVDALDRVAFWEEYNARELVGLTCSSYRPEGLKARWRGTEVEGIRLAEIVGNPHVVDRSQSHVRRSPKESVFISLLTEGSGFFYHADGVLQVRKGDAVVYTTTQPYLFGFDSPLRQIVIDLPSEVLAPHGVPKLPAQPFIVTPSLPGRGVRSQALASFAKEVFSGAPGETLETGLLGLALGVLAPQESNLAIVCRAARDYIRAHLDEPGLSADSTARALGISARHLNRGFAAEDSTVTRFISAERLAAARRELMTAPAGSIADIAVRWGFSSQAHFTRAFRRTYGSTPSETRAAKQAGHG